MANTRKTITCKKCGQEFEGWANQGYCGGCKHKRRLETERARMARIKGKPVAEGKWRCPICGCFKDKDAFSCVNCHNQQKQREKNANWKGGKTRAHGYIFIRVGAGKDAKYTQEHRLVWEETNGPIPKGYVIHHLNGIKDDNRLENLACLPVAAHSGPAIHAAYKARIRQLEKEKELWLFQT